ncbi:MAG: tRNA nucleotidyltransferase [Clostridia bacterium]|nr:tRNA nucleotidyltransferase [Clostridia bacterium]
MEKLDVGALPGYARAVMAGLREAGHAAFYAGGCVRDVLLGVVPGDVDIATSARPEEIMAIFPHSVPTGIRHGTVTVVTEGGSVEVTAFRGEGDYSDGRHPDAVVFGVSPEEDAKRRDFTVNALFADDEGNIFDYVGGRADLSAGIIRTVGDAEQRFSEDALRLLRALRFRAKTGFAIAPETEAALKKLAHLTEQVAAERIYDEICKTLCTERPEAVSEMLGCGLIPAFGKERLPAFAERALQWASPEVRRGLFCALLVRTGRISAPADFGAAMKCERKTVLLSERILAAAEYAPHVRKMLTVGGVDGACAGAELFERRNELLAEIEEVLRRGEAYRADMLALRGGEIAAMLCDAAQTAQMQRRLLWHVLDRPEDNTPERLKECIREWEA